MKDESELEVVTSRRPSSSEEGWEKGRQKSREEVGALQQGGLASLMIKIRGGNYEAMVRDAYRPG
jgi:hypothetical protein